VDEPAHAGGPRRLERPRRPLHVRLPELRARPSLLDIRAAVHHGLSAQEILALRRPEVGRDRRMCPRPRNWLEVPRTSRLPR
jgi:hypothetical protein